MKNFSFQLKYTLILTIRSKSFVFWMTVFPLILCTAFYLAFSNLDNDMEFKVKLGIVEGSQIENILSTIPILDIEKNSEIELEKKLKNDEIDGFLDNNYDLILLSKSENQNKNSILINTIKEVKKYSQAYAIKGNNRLNLGLSNNDILRFSFKDTVLFIYDNKIYESLNFSDFEYKFTDEITYISSESSILKTVFYSSFGMFSLYGIYISLFMMYLVQGYLSPLACRISVSPYKKSTLIAVVFIDSFLLNIFFNLIIMSYVSFVLKIKLFSNLNLTVLTLLIASLLGNSIGILIGIGRKLSNEKKTVLTSVLLLILSFSCGMNGSSSIKLLIEDYFPLFNRINPVNLVNESLYKINLIHDINHLARNWITLIAMSIVLLLISFITLRRKSYDSL